MFVATLSESVIASSIASRSERSSTSSCFSIPPPATRSPAAGSRSCSPRLASPRATQSRTAQQSATLITDAVGKGSSPRRPTSSPRSRCTAWNPSLPENDCSRVSIRSSNGRSGRGVRGTRSILPATLTAHRRDRRDGHDYETDAHELSRAWTLAEEDGGNYDRDGRELGGKDARDRDRAAVDGRDEREVGRRVTHAPGGYP